MKLDRGHAFLLGMIAGILLTLAGAAFYKLLPSFSFVKAPAAAVPADPFAGRPSSGPINAPVTLVEYSDFLCPFCKQAEPTIDLLMKNYAGKIRRVWQHYPLAMHTGAFHTHEASECAHEQGKFWEYHAKLFATQGSPRDEAALIQLAEQIGLNKQKFQACLASGRYKDLIQKEIAKGREAGVRGTPAFLLNGRPVTGAQPYQTFANTVEGILDPSKAAPVQAPPPPPPPPVNVTFNDLDGKPSEGPANAAVTLVIFSDFYCPFCKRVEPTLDLLMKNYAGKIRRVWRHFPLPFHVGSERAHEASECAHEQGKFWEYHRKLFEGQGTIKDDADLIKFAKEIGLNKKKFKSCLDSGKYKEAVQKDIARGAQVGVDGTPAIFVNGQLISGAQPYENFDAAVKTKLSEKPR